MFPITGQGAAAVAPSRPLHQIGTAVLVASGLALLCCALAIAFPLAAESSVLLG